MSPRITFTISPLTHHTNLSQLLRRFIFEQRRIVVLSRLCGVRWRAADNCPRFLTNCHGDKGWQTVQGVGATAEAIWEGVGCELRAEWTPFSYYVKCRKQKQKITSEQNKKFGENSKASWWETASKDGELAFRWSVILQMDFLFFYLCSR